ncbi:hypothetical protein cypCar_00018586 [Cyprinus carpio]|nr:hypothetical protein cypCar_00018586 [Cyprinus carpio]
MNTEVEWTVPRSLTSSEDEMASSVSNRSQESSSESSKEEAIYETIRTERMTDVRAAHGEASQKVVRFDPSASVWAARQRLKDVLNYASSGQFLDEEHLVAEYPQLACENIPSLEFHYCTVLSLLSTVRSADEKQIDKLHTKANLRRFIDYIQHHQLEKLSKMLDRGLDPNYHDMDTGVRFPEVPLNSRQRGSLQKNSLSVSRGLLRSSSDMNLVTRAVSPEQLSLSPQKMQRDPSGRGKMTGRGGRTVPSSHSLSISLEDEQSVPQKCVNGRPCGQSSRRKLYSAVLGRYFIAVRSYQAQAGGELSLHKNDRVRGQRGQISLHTCGCEFLISPFSILKRCFASFSCLVCCVVLSVGEGGYWEGCCRGNVGWFPARCLEEIPVKPDKERPKSRMELSDRKKLFRHFTVGSYDSMDRHMAHDMTNPATQEHICGKM